MRVIWYTTPARQRTELLLCPQHRLHQRSIFDKNIMRVIHYITSATRWSESDYVRSTTCCARRRDMNSNRRESTRQPCRVISRVLAVKRQVDIWCVSHTTYVVWNTTRVKETSSSTKGKIIETMMSRCTSHSGRRRRSQHTKGIYITYVVWDTTHVRWIDKASFWKVTSAVSAQEHSTLNATAERIRISYIGWQSYSARRKLFTESIRQCRMCQHQTTREWRYLGNSNLNLPRKIHDIRKQKYEAHSFTPVEGNLMPVT